MNNDFFKRRIEESEFDFDFVPFDKVNTYDNPYEINAPVIFKFITDEIAISRKLLKDSGFQIYEYNRIRLENEKLKAENKKLRKRCIHMEEDIKDLNEKRERGVPTIQQLERCCGLFMTREDIRKLFNCSDELVSKIVRRAGYKGFPEFFAQHSEAGKASLREAQFISATVDRNPTMLKFLGINYLGQHESQKIEIKKIGYDNGMLMLNDQRLDFFRLSEAEFETLSRLIEKAKVPNLDNLLQDKDG